jgi:hypothetical protein
MHQHSTRFPTCNLPVTSSTKTTLPYPDENELGSVSLIDTWCCDTGASSHMNPILFELEQVDEDINSLVENILQFM